MVIFKNSGKAPIAIFIQSMYINAVRSSLLILALFCSTAFGAKSQTFGEPSFITSVYFGGGSFFVDFEQSTALTKFLSEIPSKHNFIITVHSHTDNVGGKEYNQWLSQMRSESVIEELIMCDEIKREMIEIKDFGLFNPVYDNTTREGRQKNRRVDVIFWLAI